MIICEQAFACHVLSVNYLGTSQYESGSYTTSPTTYCGSFWVKVKWSSAGGSGDDHWEDNWRVEIWEPGSGSTYPPSGSSIKSVTLPWNIDSENPQTGSSKTAKIEITGLSPGGYTIRAWVKRTTSTGENVWEHSSACSPTVVAACTGCESCVNGSCEDNDNNCTGCEICEDGSCEDDDDNCTGCESCVDGWCFDDDDNCTGCESCVSGSCEDDDDNCTGCEECVDGVCVDEDDNCGACESCISGSCVDDCSASESCCDETCFNFSTHMCCGDNICRQPCCDDSECTYCDNGICESCLYNASDYEELEECSNVVDDPDWTPQPNGCSSPLGNNPAWYVCGEASSFLGPCNAHDECYQTCESNRSSCDSTFGSALDAVCAPLSGNCKSTCQFYADEYEAWVTTYGEPYWEDGQVNACACCLCE